MRTLLVSSTIFALILLSIPAFAGEVVDTSTYGELLEKYVDGQGRVDYDSWADDTEDREKLKSHLSKIADASLEGHDDDQKLAFYLNAYNAIVLHAILEHWPTDSPQSIDGFFEKKEYEVAGTKRTLDHLEHQLIRKKFDEPRIHFVLVCAAHSCPPLRREPLEGETLDETLEAATSSFVASATTVEDGSVVTSRLFKWFSSDFEEAEGSVRAYLRRYVDGKVEEKLDDEEVEIQFSDYDWTVNKQ